MLKLKHLLQIVLLLCATVAMAQQRTVTGTVRNSLNAPVAGATVSQKGTTNATITNETGTFAIKVPGTSTVLIVTSVGYASQELTVAAGTSTLDVSLADDTKQLGEVVVTALGISRQAKTLVYAAQTVKPAELTEARDANNVLNSLQGKVANAVITQGSGGPGSGARIVLRGNRSLQGSNNALIVVDGIPFSNGTNGTGTSDFGSVQGSDGASNINPDDIESMTVLRGASAAALYGSQAGNGVIVITTKKGKKDRLSVSLNSGIAMETAFALPKVQNTYGQGNGNQLRTDTVAYVGDSWGPKMTGQSYVDALGNQNTYSAQPDNIKDFFRKGISTNNSIAVNGGNEKMQGYLSYTNNNIQGIIRQNNLMRHTINLRLSNQISKRFSTDAKITYIAQQIDSRPRTGEENSPVADIYQIPRNVSTKQAKQYQALNNVGIATPTAWPSTLSSIYQNPYWMVYTNEINETRDRVVGFLSAKFNITSWLSITGRGNLDRIFDRGEDKIAQGTILWGKTGGDYQREQITATDKWFDAILEGNNKITQKLKVTYRAGAIYQDSKWDENFQGAGGLNITNKYTLNFATAPAISSGYTEVQTQAVFGQLNLSYKDAIFLDASLRNDWDSRLPKPHTYQYPSVGVSAILSDLMSMPTELSFLKASINYAQVGNGGKFGLLQTVYNYGQGAGNGFLSRSSTLPLPGLKPEIVKNLEFGIDARFMNNRIGFTATYYKSNSFNQLLNVALPVATGYSSKYINAGNIQNSGFELVINGSPIASKDFTWDVTFNLAANKNKIIRLSDDVKIFYLGGGFGRSGTPVVQEGKSYGDLLAFKWATDAKGNRLVTDAGKPVITQDQEYVGNFNPKATLGFTNSFTYKQFSLRLLIDGRAGGVMVSGTEMNLAFSGIPAVTDKYREGGWNLGGVNASGAAVSANITAQDFWQIASGKRYGNGEFFTYDATNFRVRELTVGYNIPLKSNIFVKSVKFNVVARNLLWIYRGKSKMDIPGIGKRTMWFDPDMSLGNANFQGVEYGALPATRSIGANLQVTF
jgi:TonB-linked SusC/RagA family outer membrane protein